jgi:glycosyltransferase involved in cell wall biosynthesis
MIHQVATSPAHLVSVVIPTRNRPKLVVRAVCSALAQTHRELEVIVIIDGADCATRTELSAFDDPRLRVVELSQSVGGAEARNIGARHATGQWVAFLDDDDEWLSSKLEVQLEAASTAACEWPLVCSQVIGRTQDADFIWPENVPSRPYTDYLLVRSRLGYGEGLIQTSTILTRRGLLEHVAFRKGLRKHQDWDWVIRCTQITGVDVVFVPTPLAIWTLDDSRVRTSTQTQWRASFEWIKSVRALVSARAYSSFIATYVAPQAAEEGAWRALVPLLSEIIFGGSPRARDVAVFGGAWLLPVRLRNHLRRYIRARASAKQHLMAANALNRAET